MKKLIFAILMLVQSSALAAQVVVNPDTGLRSLRGTDCSTLSGASIIVIPPGARELPAPTYFSLNKDQNVSLILTNRGYNVVGEEKDAKDGSLILHIGMTMDIEAAHWIVAYTTASLYERKGNEYQLRGEGKSQVTLTYATQFGAARNDQIAKAVNQLPICAR